MLRKINLITLTMVMVFSILIVPTGTLANENKDVDLAAIENMKLTPGEQKRADELLAQYYKITKILSNLSEEEQKRFLDALFNSDYQSKKGNEEVVLAEGTQEVTDLNEMFKILGSSVQFSPETESVTMKKDGQLAADKPNGEAEMVTFGFWGGVWDATKCTASIAAVFFPGAKAYKAIKALGGVKNTVKLLAGASNADDWLEIGGWAAAEILGVAGVEKYCFG